MTGLSPLDGRSATLSLDGTYLSTTRRLFALAAFQKDLARPFRSLDLLLPFRIDPSEDWLSMKNKTVW